MCLRYYSMRGWVIGLVLGVMAVCLRLKMEGKFHLRSVLQAVVRLFYTSNEGLPGGSCNPEGDISISAVVSGVAETDRSIPPFLIH